MHSAMAAACLLAATISGHVAERQGAGPLEAARADSQQRWSALGGSRGVTISVEDQSGKHIDGTLLAVEGDSLVLRVGAQEQRIVRAAIRQVTWTRRDSVRSGMLIGAVAGAGMAAGSSCYVGNRKCGGAQRAAFVALGAALWAAIGGVIDGSVEKRTVLYKAPRTTLDGG